MVRLIDGSVNVSSQNHGYLLPKLLVFSSQLFVLLFGLLILDFEGLNMRLSLLAFSTLSQTILFPLSSELQRRQIGDGTRV